jgi:hypothetical protein
MEDPGISDLRRCLGDAGAVKVEDEEGRCISVAGRGERERGQLAMRTSFLDGGVTSHGP